MSSSLNFGGIGMVVGHEVGHAFDDAGSTYDEAGNLNENIFSAEDRAAFRKRVGCYESLYQNVSIAPGITVSYCGLSWNKFHMQEKLLYAISH